VIGDDVLHAPRGVIERNGIDPRMVAEEIAALIERHGMREYFAHCTQFHAGGGD
jgi:hypothetical protein